MPPRILTYTEWSAVVNHIARAQHLLSALPREPELTETMSARVRELDDALRLLGFDPKADQGELQQFFDERIPPKPQ